MSRLVVVRLHLILLGLLVVLSASLVIGQDNTTDGAPPEVSDHQQEWPLANLDYANTRNTPSDINTDNVDQLGGAWTFDIPSAAYFGAIATNPLIIDGVVYFETLTSHVYALSLEDGSIIWDRDYDAENIGPNGVAVGWGKVFAVNGTAGVVALDMENGDELWKMDLPLGPTEGIDIQPTVYNNLVYVSSVPGVAVGNFYEGGGAGEIYALSQETGEIAWQFDTIDSQDIWGNPDVNSGGGSWYPPAIDVDNGMTYWTVANPAPWPGTEEFPNGTSRPGDNLYTNSLVALSATTGGLEWYTQVKAHDLFDLDLQLSPILGTATVSGTEHNVVFSSGKLGTVYAMDRDSGEILWSTDVGEHQNDHLQEIPPDVTIKVLPGSLGGVETPMALSDDGILYVPLLNQPSFYTATAYAESDEEITPTGQLLALDANTGAIIWTQTFDQPDYGAATVTNDLVFTATFDGTVYAFDRQSGEQVWSWTAPSGINGFGAVVGDTVVWPVGVGQTPQLIALRLGASMPTEANAEATQAPSAGETTSTSPQAEQTAMPEQPDNNSASSPINQGDTEATAEAGMDMGSGNAAGQEATSEAGAAGSDMSQYMTVDEAAQTVNVTIIGGLGNANGGLNFNGRDHGGATITVPEGWTVHVTFTNQGTLPHSAMVVSMDQVQETTIDAPIFDGATTPNPNNGNAPDTTVEFEFTADTQGEYAIACGVPGHGIAGQWLHFNVGGADAQPSFELSEPEAGGGAGTGI